MLNLQSSDNHAGWLHYFASHLLCNCGVSRSDLEEAINREAQQVSEYDWQTRSCREMGEKPDPTYVRPYISDNQCVMYSMRWFYVWNPIKQEFYVNDRNRRRRQVLETVRINNEALAWWIKHFQS